MKPVLKLDYSDWTSDSVERRQMFVNQIMESLQSTGFVKLTNHGIDEKQLTEVFRWSRDFFQQPLEVKRQVESTTNPVRGYTTTGAETTTYLGYGEESPETKDSKESFDQGSRYDDEFPNKWPRDLPGFRIFMEAFFERCEGICLSLVKALEAGLGVQDECITERCVPSDTDFRLTHYPAIPMDDITSGRVARIASHMDFGVITLVFQDAVGGLEIEDRTKPGLDNYVPVPPTEATEMVINLGETMQRWTNGALFGGMHRVNVPVSMKENEDPKSAIVPERYSVVYLYKAKKDTSIGPISSFVNESNPAKYPEMSGIDFHKHRNGQLYGVGSNSDVLAAA